MRVLDLIRFDPALNCFVLKGLTMKLSCNCHPDSPFHWQHNQRPSIFARDHTFCAKGMVDKSIGQVQSEYLDTKRADGVAVGYIHGLSKQVLEKEKRLIAYKQFGTYSKAKPSIKYPNKHES